MPPKKWIFLFLNMKTDDHGRRKIKKFAIVNTGPSRVISIKNFVGGERGPKRYLCMLIHTEYGGIRSLLVIRQHLNI